MKEQLKTREECIEDLESILRRLELVSDDVDSFTDTDANQARKLIGTAMMAVDEARTYLKP